MSLAGGVAVRSSAVDEDGAHASFAGQHATCLGVRDVDALAEAIDHVRESALSSAALAYRAKLGLLEKPRMGIVVQTLVHADVAGVLFTRHPITGADERVIEATWGLGEAVVSGLVTPDSFRVARGGKLVARTLGEKDLMIVYDADGSGTCEVPVPSSRQEAFCLSEQDLIALDALTTRCESLFGEDRDLEWAFSGGELFLLQSRSITRAR
jgi:pyruvate,water dikinase